MKLYIHEVYSVYNYPLHKHNFMSQRYIYLNINSIYRLNTRLYHVGRGAPSAIMIPEIRQREQD